MKKIITNLSIVFLVLISISAQATTYATTGNGDWLGTGSLWSPALPTSGTAAVPNIIIIQAGHTVTISYDDIILSNVVLYVYGRLNMNSNFSIPAQYANIILTGTGAGVIIQPGGSLAASAVFVTGIDIRVNGTQVWDGGDGNIINSATQVKIPVSVFDPLPIVLTNWKVITSGSTATAIWTTSSETNNNYYTIESSENGVDFTKVATIASKGGNSNSLQEYTYTIESTESGLTYYRLKQTDVDGTSNYSSIVSVNNVSENNLSVYPNPVTGKFFSLASDKKIQHISITSAQSGHEIYFQEFSSSSNETFNIELQESINAGLYILHIQHESGTENKTVMIY